MCLFVFFKQKTAYELRISDWSSDVCSSDLTATAFVGEYGHNVARFADARQFAANIGITPSEHSSGEKRRLGAITKRGNPYPRKLLVQCAQAEIGRASWRERVCQYV